MARGFLAACLLFLQAPPQIQFDPQTGVFSLIGVRDLSKPEIFTVTVDVPGGVDIPPLVGRYRIDNSVLIFTPTYPLSPGVRYRAVARPPGAAPITRIVELPKPDMTPTTVVQNVYPSTGVVPENNLKFYIKFSAPMSRGEAYPNIRLLDGIGKPVEMPFLELGEELWDYDGSRFTLFFDPGRIKTDLVPNNELGLAIREGQKYTLVIDSAWLDGDGKKLKSEFRKNFSVGPADRQPIDINAWKVRAPASNTRDAVTVVFSEPLDHEILLRELEIVDAAGDPVIGLVNIDQNETRWSVTPTVPWKSGSYFVRVGTAVADLAGNMIDRPFEVDVFERVETPKRETRMIPFNIR